MSVLGIDIGTTNTKVGVFDLDGTRTSWTARRTPSTVDELVSTVLDTVRQCVAECAEPPEAVGVAGMAETGAALDRAGRPLTPLLFWTDPRGAVEAEQLNRSLGAAELYRATGRTATAKSPLAKWLWLRRDQPAVLDGMAQWVGAPDVALWALTGRAATHPTSASRTLAFRLADGDYDADLLAVAGLRVDQLPALTGFDGHAGGVGATAAAATGLRAGTPVVNTGHDHTVGAWAAGAREPGTACLSLGTTEAVVLPTAGRSVLDAARAHGFTTDYAADGIRACLVGGLPTCGALIEWLLGMVGVGADERHERLSSLLAEAQVPTGIVLLPYLRGRGAPAPDARALLAIHGMAATHGPGDLLAAAIEGTCLHARWMTEVAAEVARVRLDRVVLTGGQTGIALWRRIKAALGPVPVVVTRAADAVCVGAALRAAATLGMTGCSTVVPTDPITVDRVLSVAYQSAYQRFRAAVDQPVRTRR